MSVKSSENTTQKSIVEIFEFDQSVTFNQQPAFLAKIEIDGLFGIKNFNWTLNDDVNVLVGKNGSGKSTLLKILLNLIHYILSTTTTPN